MNSDEIRVPVVLANAHDDEAVARSGRESEAGVRRVVTEGVVDLVDSRVTPLQVPEDLVKRLGLRELKRRWEGRPWASAVTVRIGGRTSFGECVVGSAGSAVRIGSMTLRQLDLIPDAASRTLRPGTGLRI